MSWGFAKGQVYNRRADIHARFGGQQQGGIFTPQRVPLVFIVTGSSGLNHGYEDNWRPDGVFEYFGEGQIGDMRWKGGNVAIRDHAINGEQILLFRKGPGGLVFEDEMVYCGHLIRRAPDTEGNLRDAFVFELRPISAVIEESEALPSHIDDDLAALRVRAMDAARETVERTKTTTTIFQRSRDVKDYVRARAKGRCEGCEQNAPFECADGSPYLEPHHLRRLSDGGPDDPRYLIALCPNCHRRVHSGRDGKDYNGVLLEKMKTIET